MTCSVRVLSTTSVDSSPAILLIAPNGSKTLVNCGEGCQRVFLEFGQKLSTVNRICLTHLSHSTLGGLPGMILTSADAMANGVISTAKSKAETAAHAVPGSKAPKRMLGTDEKLPGLDLVGPEGLEAFVHSLRHFMRREAFELRVREGEYIQQQSLAKNEKSAKRRKSSKENSGNAEEDIRVQSIVCKGGGDHQFLSFIFTTPPIQGKFLMEKAKALGIPRGPLFGQLKAGKSVSFVHPETSKEVTVESGEVVEPGLAGLAVAVLYYPSEAILSSLIVSNELSKLKQNTENNNPALELIIHITSKSIFLSELCSGWRANLGPEIKHMFVDMEMDSTTQVDTGTPFQSTAAGATCRSKLSSDIFIESPVLVEPRTSTEESLSTYTRAIPLLEYTIVPRSKKGFSNQNECWKRWSAVQKKMLTFLKGSGAIELSRELTKPPLPSNMSPNAEIIFTGTGSAIPCKHRNVSGIYLQMANSNSILLDVGEGTIGQLLRAKKRQNRKDVLSNIKAVFISHPHADHHLGILRLLSERGQLLGGQNDAVVVIAPYKLNLFLREYEKIDVHVRGSYNFVDCQELTSNPPCRQTQTEIQDAFKRLKSELGISDVQTTAVQHCAHSYAVTIRGTSFGTVAYSGDCRPSMRFAEDARNADLLIHEATFTDGMEAEAALKRHSTNGEALHVASVMKAKAVVLTHFSQRFPKIPPLSKNGDSIQNSDAPVIFAFDYMKLTPTNLAAASKITPALRLLYSEDSSIAMGEEDDAKYESNLGAANVPGLFAQKELL